MLKDSDPSVVLSVAAACRKVAVPSDLIRRIPLTSPMEKSEEVMPEPETV